MSNPSNRAKEIEIVIPFDGSEPTLEMLGYDGLECSADSKDLIDIIGGKFVKSEKKPEYFRLKHKNQLKQKK